MTDPRPNPGQIDAPNPVELFWEKNRKPILGLLVVAAIGIAINYAIAYYQRQQRNELWSTFATGTNLDAGYAADGEMLPVIQSMLQQNQQQQQQTMFQMMGYYLGATRAELVSELPEDLRALSDQQLVQTREKLAGTPAEPLVLWLSAVRAQSKQEWDAALGWLDQLEKGFPEHFLCVETDYPPQYRAPVEKADKNEKPKPGETPELVAAEPGSMVGELRGAIAREREFRAAHASLYQAPEPAPSPEVQIKFESPFDRTIRIRFYPDAAPSAVEAFLAQVRAGYYAGMIVDEVRRAPLGSVAPTPQQFHLGLTKDTDRSTWAAARAKPSEAQVEFEDNDLSHFPGMVALDAEADGKASAQRFWIVASDAPRLDGTRVIIGRVVEEDLPILEDIVGRAFADEQAENAGRGALLENIVVESATVVES